MKGKIFNAQEVQSILNGSKVMFREVIKPQPEEKIKGYFYSPNQTTGYCESLFVLDKCPYKVGQEIFVKESFFEQDNKILFKASHQKLTTHFLGSIKWKPAQHMKQEQSRLTLRITGIKIERLQSISEEDARKEGIVDGGCGNCGESQFVCKCITPEPLPVDAFIFDWNATHKKPEEKFEANPWVWCINFEVVK